MGTYNNLTDVILRADLLRLLVMWQSGGVYSDIDTNCLKPILDWIPEAFHNTARVVVGVEIDLSHDDVSEDMKKRFQLCQWTIMAAPGNKHLERVIDLVIDRVEKVAEEKGVSVSDLGNQISIPEVGAHNHPAVTCANLTIAVGDYYNRTNCVYQRSNQQPFRVSQGAL
jgi:hypothetical protein